MGRKVMVIAFLGLSASVAACTTSSSTPTPSTPTVTATPPRQAAQVRSWQPMGTHPEDYEFSIDKSVAHGGKASALLKSKSVTAKPFGGFVQSIKADDYRGKRLRMSGYAKAEGVVGWAGLWMRIDGPKVGQIIALDNMHDRAIKGTSDWVRYEVVLDVPSDAAIIIFGALLDGAGQVWVDDSNLDIVDASVATTADRIGERPRHPQNLDFEE